MKAEQYFHKRLEQIRMRKRDNLNQISCYADDVYKIMQDYAKQKGQLLLDACEEFVRKVECGEAKSRRSYQQMKEAITKFKDDEKQG